MLIKFCTKENDDVFILFVGSGSELILCRQLKRNFISCEIHPEYHSMIKDRLVNNGVISKMNLGWDLYKNANNNKAILILRQIYSLSYKKHPLFVAICITDNHIPSKKVPDKLCCAYRELFVGHGSFGLIQG